MALIPPDAGMGLRMQTNLDLLQPTAPVAEIPTDLPDLRTGQTFSARIQDVLPENTFRALVAGKQITLQLPEGAKSGDILELVVLDRTPKVVIAQLAERAGGAAAAAEPYQYATLSRSGQIIGNLLLPEGEAPRPAALNRGEPLLPQPPTRGADLVPVLQKAVAESGLFYESHQAQWVAAKLPIEQLLQEPQGQRSAPATLAQHGVTQHPLAPDASRAPTLAAVAENPTLMQTLFGTENRNEAPAAAQQSAAALAQAMPEELRPIVQQQLDAVATQRLIWHGEAWPNQTIEWEIVRGDEQGNTGQPEEDNAWRTTLRLDTPRLGHVDAALRLTATGIHIAITTPADTTVTNLRTAAPALAAALDAAGVTLLSFQAKQSGSGE